MNTHLPLQVERFSIFHRASSEQQRTYWLEPTLKRACITVTGLKYTGRGSSAPLLFLYTIQGMGVVLAYTYITHSTQGKVTSGQVPSLPGTPLVKLVWACCCAWWRRRLAGKEQDLGSCSPYLQGWSQGTLLWLLCRRGSGDGHPDQSSWGPSTSSPSSLLLLAAPLLSASWRSPGTSNTDINHQMPQLSLHLGHHIFKSIFCLARCTSTCPEIFLQKSIPKETLLC